MSPEEYERIKQAEKEHLRALKKLKQAARGLSRQQKIRRSLENLTHASDDVLDTHTRLVEELAMETAKQEARLEIALESAAAKDDAAQAEAAHQAADEELQKLRAQELVRQMKLEAGGGDAQAPNRPARTDLPAGSPTDPKPPPKSDPDSLPEKTLGRMRK